MCVHSLIWLFVCVCVCDCACRGRTATQTNEKQWRQNHVRRQRISNRRENKKSFRFDCKRLTFPLCRSKSLWTGLVVFVSLFNDRVHQNEWREKKTNEQKINILMVGFADEDENGSQKIICLSIDRKTLLTFSEQTYDCTKKEIEIIWSVFTLLRSNDENVLTKNHHKKKILNRNEACILLVWMCIGHSMRWKSKDQNQKRWEATKRLKARARKNCTRNQFSMR